MGNLKIGDIVARKSYGGDILFKVVDIRQSENENIITLKGLNYRIEADAPESDLEVQSEKRIEEYNRQTNMPVRSKASKGAGHRFGFYPKASDRNTPNDEAKRFTRSGRVLHLDGDEDYLNRCLEEYKKLGINAVGKHVPESQQPASVKALLAQYEPDILVLTGHDGIYKESQDYLNVNNYRNSKYFIEAVKEARKYEPDVDRLVIFAGACQSMYKGILDAGANYASAPYRVLIHALDPVLVAQKIAMSGIDKILNPTVVIGNTRTGYKGIGGIETRGKLRNGYPEEPYAK
mgnify:CR=1 FL=1